MPAHPVDWCRGRSLVRARLARVRHLLTGTSIGKAPHQLVDTDVATTTSSSVPSSTRGRLHGLHEGAVHAGGDEARSVTCETVKELVPDRQSSDRRSRRWPWRPSVRSRRACCPTDRADRWSEEPASTLDEAAGPKSMDVRRLRAPVRSKLADVSRSRKGASALQDAASAFREVVSILREAARGLRDAIAGFTVFFSFPSW